MSCQYKNECPSYSGWCEGPKQDFSRCIPFLVTAYENIKNKLREYEKNEDVRFKDYVERYCRQYNYSPEQAINVLKELYYDESSKDDRRCVCT